MAEKKSLPLTSPESVGIPSEAVSRFLKKLEEDNLCMHSVLMLRHGKLAKESFGSMTMSLPIFRRECQMICTRGYCGQPSATC